MLDVPLAAAQPHAGVMRQLSVTEMTTVLPIELFKAKHCVFPSAGSDVPGCQSMGPHAADVCSAYHAGTAHLSSGTFQRLGFGLLNVFFE